MLDVALVLSALIVSALLTVLLLRSFGLSLNFANIIALPLLLGVGVSFNIYFVMNWRRREHALFRIGHRPRRHVLLAHHRHRVRLAGPLGAPRHREHGHLAAHEPVLHGRDDVALCACAACGGASSACSAWRI